MALMERQGMRVWVCAEDGPALGSDRDAADVMAEAWGHQASFVVIPAARLARAFFDLRTGVAGQILQRFAMYGWRIAIIGDVAAHLRASAAFAALVAECNRGGSVWFVPGYDELDARLTAARER